MLCTLLREQVALPKVYGQRAESLAVCHPGRSSQGLGISRATTMSQFFFAFTITGPAKVHSHLC